MCFRKRPELRPTSRHATMQFSGLCAVGLLLLMATTAQAAPIVRSAAGVDPASIQATVDLFRNDLGALNPNVVGSLGTGRREINWDAVPDAFATPTDFPLDFFNQPIVGRARGAEFSTATGSGSTVRVSANAGITPVEFGDINPAYDLNFQTFSPQRLFGVVGDEPIFGALIGIEFFVPGTNTPATVSGFGAVFTGVDLTNGSGLLFQDENGDLIPGPDPLAFGLEGFAAPSGPLSFVGASFTDGTRIRRVVVVAGTHPLNASVEDDLPNSIDIVALDDFIYAEPVAAVPEPSSVALMAVGLMGLVAWRRRRIA